MSDLLNINVNAHTEKKGQLTYLSWAWAWAEVLKIDPAAEWEVIEYPQPDGTLAPCMWLRDGTAMVKTRVTIKGKARSCQLPVMDNRNNAIKNPDARKISDAAMRCMTKAISMHGLGLYIYAGEDLPESDDKPEESNLVPVLQASIEQAKAAKVKRGGVVQDVLQETPEIPAEVRAELDETAADIVTTYENGEGLAAIAAYYGIPDNHHKVYVWGQLDSKLRSFLKTNNPHSQPQKAA
jgi:hypothetical protein